MWPSTTTPLPITRIRPVVGAAMALHPALMCGVVVVASASVSLLQRVAKCLYVAPAPSAPPSLRKATSRGLVAFSSGVHRPLWTGRSAGGL